MKTPIYCSSCLLDYFQTGFYNTATCFVKVQLIRKTQHRKLTSLFVSAKGLAKQWRMAQVLQSHDPQDGVQLLALAWPSPHHTVTGRMNQRMGHYAASICLHNFAFQLNKFLKEIKIRYFRGGRDDKAHRDVRTPLLAGHPVLHPSLA